MAEYKDVGEVSVALSHDEVKAGVKEMVGKNQVGGVNSTFRVDKTTANVSGDGVTTTPIAVVVTKADPAADKSKGPAAGVEPTQRVAPPKGVVNNTPVEAAPQPAKLGAPAAAAAPAVSAPSARPQLAGGRSPGRGLAVRQPGPVAQAKAGPLAPPPPRASGALAVKKDDGPKAAGSEGQQAGPKLEQQAPAPHIGVKEEVITIQGGLNAKHSRKRQIETLGMVRDDPGAQMRNQNGPKSDDQGPQQGFRPNYASMPRDGLQDGPTPNQDAPQIVLDKPAPKAAATARIAPPTAKMANVPAAAPSPYGNRG